MGDKVPFSKGDLFRLKKWVAFELGFEAWLGLKEINIFCFFWKRQEQGGAGAGLGPGCSRVGERAPCGRVPNKPQSQH